MGAKGDDTRWSGSDISICRLHVRSIRCKLWWGRLHRKGDCATMGDKFETSQNILSRYEVWIKNLLHIFQTSAFTKSFISNRLQGYHFYILFQIVPMVNTKPNLVWSLLENLPTTTVVHHHPRSNNLQN